MRRVCSLKPYTLPKQPYPAEPSARGLCFVMIVWLFKKKRKGKEELKKRHGTFNGFQDVHNGVHG
jgi:hypothetical protein